MADADRKPGVAVASIDAIIAATAGLEADQLRRLVVRLISSNDELAGDAQRRSLFEEIRGACYEHELMLRDELYRQSIGQSKREKVRNTHRHWRRYSGGQWDRDRDGGAPREPGDAVLYRAMHRFGGKIPAYGTLRDWFDAISKG